MLVDSLFSMVMFTKTFFLSDDTFETVKKQKGVGYFVIGWYQTIEETFLPNLIFNENFIKIKFLRNVFNW